MTWPTTIVAATDLSTASTAAVALAGSLARTLDAEVVLVTCFDPNPLLPAIAALGGGTRLGKLMDRQEAVIRKELEEARRVHVAGVPCSLVVLRESETATAITKLAERREASLLVVGSHGRTGLERVLLGSVAREVLRQASCPVIVAR